MESIIRERVTARPEGEFVVFIIGMRINRWWKPWKWLPVLLAMPRMLIELGRNPDLGLMHARTHAGFPGIMVVQYWRSFAHLHAYAAAKDREHLPAWRAFNRAVGSSGDVGIWHETYLVGPGAHESVYNNMPPFGLGRAAPLLPAAGELANANRRLKAQTNGSSSPA